MSYIAYVLTDKSRNTLLEKFPPKYSKVICHHITYSMNSSLPVPEYPLKIEVIGYANNPNGIETLQVSIDGIRTRLDNGLYHITHSLEPNKFKPKDSNNFKFYNNINPYIIIEAIPKRVQ